MKFRYTRVFATIALFLVVISVTLSPSFGKGQSFLAVSSKEYGYGLQQSREGIHLQVTKMFLNHKHVAQSITVIFDIRKDGIGTELAWKEHLAQPTSMTSVSVAWTPKMEGEYELRAFVISNMTTPEILEDVVSSKFKVISDTDFLALYPNHPTSLTITPINPAPTSRETSPLEFGGIQQFGKNIQSPNTFIGEISASRNGLFTTGVTEIPPLRENPPMSGGNLLVFFSSSFDGGATFSSKYLVNNTRALIFSHGPVIHAVNDTLIYASWLQETPYRDTWNFIFTGSIDGGRTFDRTTEFSAAGHGFLDMAVTESGKSIYLLRTETYDFGESNRQGLLLSRSNDYGKTFEPTQLILNHTGSDGIGCPQVVIQQSDTSGDADVYITWLQASEDKNIKLIFSSSHDGGIAFSPPSIMREAYSDNWDCPKVDAYKNNVYIAWTETKFLYKPEDPSELLVGDEDLYFASSQDKGITFDPPINLSEGIGAFTTEPEILISQDRIYAVWRDTIPDFKNGFLNYYGNAEVVFIKSADGGKTFDKPVNLSNNPTGSYQPTIAVYSNNVFVAWLESEFPSNEATISFKTSADGGNSFVEANENLASGISEPVGMPRLVTSSDGQKIYLIWSQRNDQTNVAETFAIIANMHQP